MLYRKDHNSDKLSKTGVFSTGITRRRIPAGTGSRRRFDERRTFRSPDSDIDSLIIEKTGSIYRVFIHTACVYGRRRKTPGMSGAHRPRLARKRPF
jgi:hypothetical protein